MNKLIISIIYITSLLITAIQCQYYQPFHDNIHTSFAYTVDSIINDLEWTFNSTSYTYTNNSYSTIPLFFNPIVLEDQSFIYLSSSTNNSSCIQFIRLNYNTEIIYFNVSIDIDTPTNNSNNNVFIYSLLVTSSQNLVLFNHLFNSISFYDINGTLEWMNNNSLSNNITCSFPQQFMYNWITINCNEYVYSFDSTNGELVNTIVYPAGSPKTNTTSPSTLIGGVNNTLIYIDYNNFGNVILYNLTDSTFTLPFSNIYNQSYYMINNNNDVNSQYINQITSAASISSATFRNSFGNTTTVQLEYISQLVCNDGTTLAVEIRDLYGGIHYYNQIVQQIDCDILINPRLSVTPTVLFVSFTLDAYENNNRTSGYLAMININTNIITWLINNQQITILDQIVINHNYVYLCTKEQGIILFTASGTKSIYYNQLNDTSMTVDSCRMAVGENSVVAFIGGVQSNTNSNDQLSQGIMRLGDSVCTFLCETNFTCTPNNCQCASGYYPASVCNVYCNPQTTCSGQGTCLQDGTCECLPGTGYYGDDCSKCKSGWFGPDCSMHFSWVSIGIGGGIAALATSAIFIFCCITKPKEATVFCKCCYTKKDKYGDRTCCCTFMFSKCYKSIRNGCCKRRNYSSSGYHHLGDDNTSLIKNMDL